MGYLLVFLFFDDVFHNFLFSTAGRYPRRAIVCEYALHFNPLSHTRYGYGLGGASAWCAYSLATRGNGKRKRECVTEGLMNHILVGFLASLGAGLATGIGALPVLLPFNMSERVQGILLGVGGGVMLAATSFSLLIPGTVAAQDLGYSETAAAALMVTGVMLGGVFLWLAHEFFPHEHFFKGREGKEAEHFAEIWLFVIAIALHNFPEGLTVGVGVGSGTLSGGLALAGGIGLQNIPEGLVVAVALRNLGYSPFYSLGVSTLTGLIEPVGGLIGASVVSFSALLLPWGMAFAAGAMLFVIIDEIIPDIDQKALGQVGTLGVMVGFVVMMFLDVTLG